MKQGGQEGREARGWEGNKAGRREGGRRREAAVEALHAICITRKVQNQTLETVGGDDITHSIQRLPALAAIPAAQDLRRSLSA